MPAVRGIREVLFGPQAPAEFPQPSGALSAPRSLRVIVVDDERDMVLTLTTLLRSEGHEVKGVYKGGDVFAAARGFDPDAILLDLALEDASGYEIARQIRLRYGERRPLLIAISGRYTKATDRMLSSLAGFDHHLPKPFDFAALLALLEPLGSPGRDN